jgi:preprotein translocase subunit SecE
VGEPMSMNLNREQKRQMRRMGAINESGAPVRGERPQPHKVEERTPPAQFVREVKGELRKVSWPTRAEVRKYSLVVLAAVVLLTAYVAGLDYVFGSAVLWLFDR